MFIIINGGKSRGLAPVVLSGLSLPEAVELVHQLGGVRRKIA